MTYESQNQKLLKLLSRGWWVGLPRIVEGLGIYRVSARVYDLRKRGHKIEWRQINHGHQRRIWYRMVKA